MKILGIESSFDDPSAAIVTSEGKVLSNVVFSHASTFSKMGGVVPEMSAREHLVSIVPTIEAALDGAKTSFQDIDLIASTEEPGLIGSLLVGRITAFGLSVGTGIPLVPVNHLDAHLWSYRLYEDGQTPLSVDFPALGVLVSGGHTEIRIMHEDGRSKIVSETVDDAVGESFDKVAKMLGLGYPGGPLVAQYATKGDLKSFDFPRPLQRSRDGRMSFSGLKTAVLREVEHFQRSGGDIEVFRANICASFQASIVDVLETKARYLKELYHTKSVILSGGVSANHALRQRFREVFGRDAVIPDIQYSTDNGAMIAGYAGMVMAIESQR